MNNKLTILDIAESVADKGGLTKKEAEQFVKEFFLLASEVISKGESLTIKGVGTFSPVWVDARTSVDVNTKESIEIPGHYKLSFSPDKSMRDAVNAPFAAFTTEIVNVNKDDDTQLSNIEETEKDSQEEIITVVEDQSVPQEQELDEIQNELDNDSTSQSDDAVDQIEDNGSIIEPEENTSDVKVHIEDKGTAIDENKIEKEYRRHTRNGYISGFLTAFVLFIAFVLIWKFFIDNEKGISLSFSSFNLSSNVEQKNEQGGESDNITKNNEDVLIVNTEDSIDAVKEEEPVKEDVVYNTNVVDEVEPQEPVIEVITRGKFLTTIAQKYYGDKVFWVYIYRENKIWNPKDLQPGDKVVVPDASKYDIDASNPESVKKAKALEQQILYEIE